MSKLKGVLLLVLLLGFAMPTLAQPSSRNWGTFKNPFPLRNYEDVGDGISLRVVGLQRPADSGNDSDTPAEGQEYVIVSLELTCDASRSENCVIASFDFEVAGDKGIIYPQSAAMDERAIDFAPYTEAFYDVSALISSDDSNLVLLFYRFPDIPYTFPLVFATELFPEPTEAIAINANIGMIARVGPGGNLDFTGVFNRGEQLLAHGRNADGTWLEIQFGWIPAEHVDAEGDIMSLPVTSR